jgi:hypothetical protein
MRRNIAGSVTVLTMLTGQKRFQKLVNLLLEVATSLEDPEVGEEDDKLGSLVSVVWGISEVPVLAGVDVEVNVVVVVDSDGVGVG